MLSKYEVKRLEIGFFEGRDDDPRYFDGQLNPFLLLLLIPAFLKFDKERTEFLIEKRVMFAFAVLFMLIAFLRTSIRIRYIVPIIPPLVILSMFGLDNLAGYLRVNGFFARQLGLNG